MVHNSNLKQLDQLVLQSDLVRNLVAQLNESIEGVIVYKSLEIISLLLRLSRIVRQGYRDESADDSAQAYLGIRQVKQALESNGIGTLFDQLQNHQSEKVYKLVFSIIQEHWDS